MTVHHTWRRSTRVLSKYKLSKSIRRFCFVLGARLWRSFPWAKVNFAFDRKRTTSTGKIACHTNGTCDLPTHPINCIPTAIGLQTAEYQKNNPLKLVAYRHLTKATSQYSQPTPHYAKSSACLCSEMVLRSARRCGCTLGEDGGTPTPLTF